MRDGPRRSPAAGMLLGLLAELGERGVVTSASPPVFTKRNTLLCTVNTRSVEATRKKIASQLDAFPAHQCANHLRASGYA